MLCLVVFIVLGILSIFSVKYRNLFKESFLCVTRRLTFRPCETDFSHKIKFSIVGWLMPKSESLAKFFHKYMEVFSWIFIVLFFASLIYTGIGVYNFIKHGTCNPDNPENCILAPKKLPQETPRCLDGSELEQSKIK